jgi:UDP-N-acetylmuramate dehydrogenase
MTMAVPSWPREDDGMAPDCAVEGVTVGAVPTEGVRGRIVQDAPLAPLVWFKAGGSADWLFEPADLADLQHFLEGVEGRLPVMALGLGSNLIVRDCGAPGVVIRRQHGARRGHRRARIPARHSRHGRRLRAHERRCIRPRGR